MDSQMVKGSDDGKMEIFIQEILKLAISAAKVLLNVYKEVGVIWVNGQMVKWMALEFVSGKIVLNTKVNGKIVLKKVKARCITLMDPFIKANS